MLQSSLGNLSRQKWRVALRGCLRPMSSGRKRVHEIWRDENEQDNLPKVRRRDGQLATISKDRGFVDYERNPDPYRDPMERVTDWGEINAEGHDKIERTVQAARCMDCGTPYCQTHTGCESIFFNKS